jgi:DNA-binding IclR family transcriptional regulator
MPGRDPTPSGSSQTLRKALSVLRILATGLSGGVSLQDIARATGLARPTVHRILKTLVAEGLVEQNARTRRYAIGEQIPLLALARPKQSALLNAAEAVVERAAAEIGDTVFLTVRTGNDTVCVARRMGTYPIQVLVIEIGARRPLGVSSAGLAILARLPEREAADVVAANMVRFANFRTNLPRVAAQVEATRRRGYALSDPGLVPGTKAISVPILTGKPETTAALTVAAVRQRLRPQREQEVAANLTAMAVEIEGRLAEPVGARLPPVRPGPD